MLIETRGEWFHQPFSGAQVDPRFGFSDVYLPNNGLGNLAGRGALAPHATYFSRIVGPFGPAFGHGAGGMYTAAATLPAAGTYASVLLVLASNHTGSNQTAPIGNTSSGLRESSGYINMRASSSGILSLTKPAIAGTVIFASWKDNDHTLFARYPSGDEEYLRTTATWGNASPVDMIGEAGRAFALVCRWIDAVPPLHIQQELVRSPWKTFEPDDEPIWLDMEIGGAAAALDGDATSQASATGDLSTGIPIIGAALAVSTGTATLSTGIPIEGAAAATSVASGQLVTSITLSGQALAQALASAALSSGIILTADSVATAAAQGTLTTAIQMIGAATAQATASGSLDAGASLAGNAQAQASAAASLTVQIQLSASALAQAAAAAGLTTAIPLGGAAVGQATAGAVLTTGIHLTAEAVAAAIAAGSLTAELRLSGQATADAYGNAALWTQIHIAGQAVALATATASLDTTASHWADGPVWMLSSVAPLTLYQVAAQPVATWSPAVEVLAQYSAGVHLVQ